MCGLLFVEGEKAADACINHGLQAVTNAGGAHQKEFGPGLVALRGRDVVLWPDNDDDGRALMDRLAPKLKPILDERYAHNLARRRPEG